MSERTFDDFDEFATDYRNIHNQNIRLSGADSLYFAQMKVVLLKQTENDGAIRLLDLGCGDGATELFVQQHFPGWRVEGIDVSGASIEVANQRQLPNAHFSVYDGTEVPFEAHQFDIVFVAGVLHHVDRSKHAAILQSIHRVLKPGGRLYLFEHNPLNPFTRYLVKTCVFDQDATLLSHRYCKAMIQQNKLFVRQCSFIIFFPRGRGWRWLHAIEPYLKKLPLGGQYYIQAIKPN